MIRKKQLNIKKYDPQHKLVLSKELTCSTPEIFDGSLLEIYEIGNTLAVFTSDIDGRVPSLYRIIVDKTKLSVIKEGQLAEMPKIKIKVAFTVPKDIDLRTPFFRVVKDPHSDNYAVCAFNTRAELNPEAIQITHYNSAHEQISQAYCTVTDEPTMKFSNVHIDVDQDRKVTVLAVTDRVMMYLGDLSAGQKSFRFDQIQMSGVSGLNDAIVRLNPVTREYVVLGVKRSGAILDPTYKTFIGRIDMDKKTMTAMPANATKVNEIARTRYKKKERFDGIPQELIMHDDGTYTVIYEEVDVHEYKGSWAQAGQRPSGITHTERYYYLNDIGITHYDKDGAELRAYYVPKSYKMTSLLTPFYYERNKNTAVHLTLGLQYKQFCYIKSPRTEYVLFNDYEDNQERVEEHSKIKIVWGTNESVAYSFDLTQASPVLKRKEVWAYKNAKKDGWLAMLGASDYTEATNTLTTLKLDYRTKDMQVVWLQPD